MFKLPLNQIVSYPLLHVFLITNSVKTSEETLFIFNSFLEKAIAPPLQYSCLENPMDGGAWWAAVNGVAKSQTQLSNFTFTFHFHALEKEMATHSSVLAWRIPGMGSLVFNFSFTELHSVNVQLTFFSMLLLKNFC